MTAQPPHTAWFHCFSGIAGDMALGALIDAGADIDEVRSMCERLPIDGWSLEAHTTLRGGIAATKASVLAEETTVVRTVRHITGLLEEARLPERVRQRSLAAFNLIAQAEGRLHNKPPSQVHLHEVGSLDAIVDIVGTSSALEVLGVGEVLSSPVAQGIGMIRSAHGLMPNPPPAVIEILQGVPTFGLDIAAEMTTPTGAALIATLATDFGPLPPIKIQASGFGAGTRELEDRPNLTQVVLGQAASRPDPGQPVMLLETNIDDATGETLAHAIGALLEAGAHDAWLTPIHMKKGRPAHTVSALADIALAKQVMRTMIDETGTLGVRAQQLERWPQARVEEFIEIDGQPVRVKVSAGRTKVELEDAANVARTTGRPVREVISLAEAAWRRRSFGGDLAGGGLPAGTQPGSTQPGSTQPISPAGSPNDPPAWQPEPDETA